jgi:phosphoribosylformylglycinamidine synthase I
MTPVPRALVLRAPGINCERETAYACRLAGFATDLVHINELRPEPARLFDYHLLVIPGGFSYGDDLGAGTLLARFLMVHLGSQLQRFIDEGRLVLGICNGFQVLVRAGLLPGPPGSSEAPVASLTINASARFECRWISLVAESPTCVFTRGLHRPIELPVAHGEGRFVLADATQVATLRSQNQIALTYRGEGYPANPNGSLENIAAVCNPRGNVLGMMPHPERYLRAMQHPQQRGLADGHGEGLLLFRNAYLYACELLGRPGLAPTAASEPRTALRSAQFPAAPTRPLNPLLRTHTQPIPARAAGGSGAGAAPRTASATALSYAASGVDIEAGERAVELMRTAVRATHGPEVLAGLGAFAGVFRATALKTLAEPALVATTDGVGTKTLLAVQAGRFEGIGYDLVNHCVNDLLTQGAHPLFFMDYLAMGRLDPVQAAAIVESVAQACQEVGCALLGGETAEMPDVYQTGTFDLAGTLVGVVDTDRRPNPATIGAGDVLLGLPSSGLHTNGYSLARRVFSAYALATHFAELGETLGEALLRPHRCYLREIERLLAEPTVSIKGLAHITGGGFQGNLIRILPAQMQARIATGSWEVPPLFRLIARLGGVSREEMYRTFNMGIGMVLVVPPTSVEPARRLVPELAIIGSMTQSTQGEGVILED